MRWWFGRSRPSSRRSARSSSPKQAVGKFAVGTIYQDQILMHGHVSTGKRAPSLSDRVPPGKVVVWLPMPDLLAGQVGFRPGDRLDILLSLKLDHGR